MLHRLLVAGAFLSALPAAAYAQGAVIQAGPVAPGHVVLWGGNGSIRDGGSQVPPGVLPKATTSALGAVIVGSGLGVATSGNLSVTYGKAGNTALQGSLYGVANGVATLDGSGLLPAAQLPFPGVSALGGAQALTAPTHQFFTGLGTNGIFTTGQPSAGDISGLGTMATQNAAAVAITGGTGAFSTLTLGGLAVTSAATTPLGTSGATIPLLSTANTWGAAQHLGTNLLDGSNIAFTGGSLNGVSVGATTPGTGAFTTLTATGAASAANYTSNSLGLITAGSGNTDHVVLLPSNFGTTPQIV